uniref:Uncharacterized protein n=1 Tax=Arundo donax TaxID=35708 RepID=A0A0A9FCQ3_ARUDO
MLLLIPCASTQTSKLLRAVSCSIIIKY